jgi:hypothetical protein
VLEPVLASDAALHLGHGEQSCRRDRLAVLPTPAVLTRVKLGERCREMVHAGQQQLTRGETHLPALTGLDRVTLIGEVTGAPDRAGPILYRPQQRALVLRAIASSPLHAPSMSAAVSRYSPVMSFGARPRRCWPRPGGRRSVRRSLCPLDRAVVDGPGRGIPGKLTSRFRTQLSRCREWVTGALLLGPGDRWRLMRGPALHFRNCPSPARRFYYCPRTFFTWPILF